MPRRNVPRAAALAFAVAAGCASKPLLTTASGLPREALPSTFAPLRWSVRPDDVPALFPNREARQEAPADPSRRVTWTVSDVRRIEGVSGALAAEWSDAGELRRVKLSFPDPRKECDPDLTGRPRHCGEPGPTLSRIHDALRAELARGRGAPETSPGARGGRTASWRGTETALALALVPDARGAWAAEASVARSPVELAPATPR